MRKMSPRIFALMLKLTDGTRSCKKLATECGLADLTVYHYLKELHRAGLIHISGWDSDRIGRFNVKLYHFGPGVDAKTKPVPRTVVMKNWRTRRAQMAVNNALCKEVA